MKFRNKYYEELEKNLVIKNLPEMCSIDAKLGGQQMIALLDPDYGGKIVKEQSMLDLILAVTHELRTLYQIYNENEARHEEKPSPDTLCTGYYLAWIISRAETFLNGLTGEFDKEAFNIVYGDS